MGVASSFVFETTFGTTFAFDSVFGGSLLVSGGGGRSEGFLEREVGGRGGFVVGGEDRGGGASEEERGGAPRLVVDKGGGLKGVFGDFDGNFVDDEVEVELSERALVPNGGGGNINF